MLGQEPSLSGILKRAASQEDVMRTAISLQQHGSRHTRRGVLAGMVAMLSSGPLLGQTIPLSGMRRLGVLSGRREDDPEMKIFEVTVSAALAALGWHEGGN